MQTQTLTVPVAAAPAANAANAGPIARDWTVTRPFVVGVDDTREAYPALKYAAELSLVTGSRVHSSARSSRSTAWERARPASSGPPS
jgi:hypothetical protein